MDDQAKELRQLVRQHARHDTGDGDPRPRRVVVTSGKGGVGTTTVAVNLAVALARRGPRVLLVDADPNGGDAAMLCRLEETHSVADVLAARRTVDEVLQDGPGGIQILPGAWASESMAKHAAHVLPRLVEPLDALGNRFDFVVVDVGNGPNPFAEPFWQTADMALVITSSELPSVMDTYASIKLMAEGGDTIPIHSLVNMAPGAAAACDVQGRLTRACWRFLGIPLHDAGHLPTDPDVAAAGRAGEPFVLAAPGCRCTSELHRLAETVTGSALKLVLTS
jgi:flagellar biosynthesis protein FlhG